MNSKTIDFSIFYKKKYSALSELNGSVNYDLFISAYNDSYRVKSVFDEINANQKHWLLFPEYFYKEEEKPILKNSGESLFEFPKLTKEGEIIRKYFSDASIDVSKARLCIDITGFIRPHLIFLVRYLAAIKVRNVDFIYTDPTRYIKKEQTDFSFDYLDVRQVDGCQGIHNTDTVNDVLIIGAGYDHLRIKDVSKRKDDTKKVQLFGFPSLQADMYQENIVKAYNAEEETSNGREHFIDKDKTLFAPANDPFITANVLKEYVDKEHRRKKITNLYLCPLSTKAQTLGMALYYISSCTSEPVSIIFPICSRYSRETTEGISRIWKYTVEFEHL